MTLVLKVLGCAKAKTFDLLQPDTVVARFFEMPSGSNKSRNLPPPPKATPRQTTPLLIDPQGPVVGKTIFLLRVAGGGKIKDLQGISLSDGVIEPPCN